MSALPRRRALLALGMVCGAGPLRAGPPPIDVRRFGVRGDGGKDEGAALRRALAALAPGEVLHFPPGRYVHGERLCITTPGVRLQGEGATLHALDPRDQAVLLQADGIRISGFTLTAVTDRRRDAPWESRIAAWRHDATAPLRDIHILGNRIVEHGPAGSAAANSSGSAAIYVDGVHGFLVQGNEVRRSLSDAIHITGGARDGQVLGNRVRESGDDMVGLVSYLGRRARADLPALAAALPELREQRLVRRVRVAGNDLAGNYWGRGISVVGGEDVVIEDNRVDATTHAAAIYLARENSYGTFGVRRVRVQGNHISRVQSTAPAYAALPWMRRGRRTGHAAVELVALLDAAEAAHAALVAALGVYEVEVLDNRIEDVATDGLRIGDHWAGSVHRHAAPVRQVRVQGNRFARIAGRPLRQRNAGDPLAAAHCAGNYLDGQPLRPDGCSPA